MAQLSRRRWLTLVYLASFVFFAQFPLFRVKTDTRVIDDVMSDHASHWSSAALLITDGFDLYRRPTQELCQPPAGEVESKWITCIPVSAPELRPLAMNWMQYPRVYPPGAMLLGALPAALYLFTPISFSGANLVMILEILIGAHLASLAMLLCLGTAFLRTEKLSDEQEAAKTFAFFLVMPFVHLELVSAALIGVYDTVAIAAVVWGVLMLRRDRPLWALLGLSLGIFTHFRALWFLPLVAVAAYQARATWRTSRSSWALVSISGALLLIALWCFVLVRPSLGDFPLKNPIHLSVFLDDPRELLTFGIPIALMLTVLLKQRHWLTASVVVWQLFVVMQTREVRNWHILFALPIIAVAGTERRAPISALATALVLYLWESQEIFSFWPLTGSFIAELLRV